MKKNSIILTVLATILGLVTSCASDELVNPNPEGTTPGAGGQQITITATLGNGSDNSSNSNPGNNSTDKPGTRMGYEPNTDAAVGGLVTKWAKGDAFNIIPIGSNKEEGTAQLFTLDEASVGNSEGTFNGTAPAKGDKYRIYHPTSITSFETFNTFFYTGQMQAGNDDRRHLTAYHVMQLNTTDYTKIDFSKSGDNFYQSSCMKFDLTPGAAITPVKITLATADGTKCFNLRNDTDYPTASLSMDLSGITLTGTSGEAGTITAYMMMNYRPVTLPDAGITVTVDAEDGSSYSQTIAIENGTTLESGKMHTLTAKNMKKVVLPSMTFKVKVTAADNTFNIPFPISGRTPADMTVDWGDESTAVEIPKDTKLTSGDQFNHIYTNANAEGTEYIITITSAQTDATKQQIPTFSFSYRTDNNNNNKLISMDTSLLNTGKKDLNNSFSYCKALTTIAAELFDNHKTATSFNNCFNKCEALTTIPAGLFTNNTAATSFSNCFNNCTALTTIPGGLFTNNTAATSFSYCFYNCVKLKLNTHIFSMTGDEDRFKDKAMNFTSCFENVGSGLDDNAIETSPASVAPDLWNYNKGTNTTWTTSNCFKGGKFSNSAAIRAASNWGTPAN